MKSTVIKRSKSTVLKRSVVLAGNKTSLSLEDEFWNGLREIARGRGETLSLWSLQSMLIGNTPICRQPFAFLCLASIMSKFPITRAEFRLFPQTVTPFVEADHSRQPDVQ